MLHPWSYTLESMPESRAPKIRFVVTMDGLAASGKSTVARQVALALGVPYVSSGLLYRAVTLLVLEANADPTDESAILALLACHTVRLEPRGEGNLAWIDDRDVTQAAHSSLVDANVSRVALHPRVRAWVNAAIRALPAPFVAEGRDMGFVFPDAPVKLYLTASAQVRAERRTRERPEDLAAVLEALQRRDALDAVNSQPAPDAVVIDSSALGLPEVVERALSVVQAVGSVPS